MTTNPCTTLREVEEWAREQSALHHQLAHENKHLRSEHIASSAAYRDVADQIKERAALQAGQGEGPDVGELVAALDDLADAARSACDARLHPPLIEALMNADALVGKHKALPAPEGEIS